MKLRCAIDSYMPRIACTQPVRKGFDTYLRSLKVFYWESSYRVRSFAMDEPFRGDANNTAYRQTVSVFCSVVVAATAARKLSSVQLCTNLHAILRTHKTAFASNQPNTNWIFDCERWLRFLAKRLSCVYPQHVPIAQRHTHIVHMNGRWGMLGPNDAWGQFLAMPLRIAK